MPDLPLDGKQYRQEQRALLILIVYRCLLVCLLLAIMYGELQVKISGPTQPALFQWVTFTYLGMILISGLAYYRNLIAPASQAQIMFLVDCIVIPLLIHSGGGLTTALGSLLASSIALTSLLVRGRMVLFLAAIATFGIFSGELYSSGLDGLDTRDFAQAGLLGAVYFAIALLAATLSLRVRESESLAQQQQRDLAELVEINQHIIQHMTTGVVVSGPGGSIRYINRAAQRLLGLGEDALPEQLDHTSPELARLWQQWQQQPSLADHHSLETDQLQLHAHFRRSGSGQGADLIFLEDASEAMRQARQIKLASLGRLTAGIAHQIRNPLSAINHAGQLLAESEAIASADRRLLEIIQANSRRVNDTIESILQLSRRQAPQREAIDPALWLPRFIERVSQSHNLPAQGISLELINPMPLHADAMQLEQVLTNLCENALRHCGRGIETHILLRLDKDSLGQPRLTLCDNGQGLSELALERLFEPFFTTRSDGTGLGLYIARELCEANNISLKPLIGDTGACFQLVFRQGGQHD